MSRHLGGLVFAITIAAGGMAHGQTEFIVNGGFEAGDFTGWTVLNDVFNRWRINNGSVNPSGPAGARLPISGSFDSVSTQVGPGAQMLCQGFTVPENVSGALFSYVDRIQNFAPDFDDPAQEFRVAIYDANLVELFEIHSTNPGDETLQLGPNVRVFDLTAQLQALAGQDVCIGFRQEDAMGFFNVTIDNVSLLIEEASAVEVAVDVKPGSDRNPVNLQHGKGNGGVLPVGVLSTDEFDATLVDESTVQLGDPNLSGAAVPLRAAEEDVDGDGTVDLMLHFSLAELVEAGAIDSETVELLLTGATFDGVEVFGGDHVDPSVGK